MATVKKRSRGRRRRWTSRRRRRPLYILPGMAAGVAAIAAVTWRRRSRPTSVELDDPEE